MKKMTIQSFTTSLEQKKIPILAGKKSNTMSIYSIRLKHRAHTWKITQQNSGSIT
jgi:hypothetical protein